MWPGATAAEMQAQVADPIEKKLQELPYFDKVTTYTKPSFTAMQVAFKDNTPARDVPQLFYQLRKKISDIKDDLPAGLIGPSINDEYGDVDSILYMITSDGADYAQMKKVAEAFRQRLLKVKDVTKVNLYGTQDEKIYVEFSNAKLATLGITTDQLFQSLARQNAVVPAGVLETTAQRVPLRVTGALDGAKAVAETPVEANGRVFRVGDIATVTHGYPDPPDFLVRQRGKAAIGVGVVMAKGANILELGPAVASATADFKAAVPQGFDFEQIADQPLVVDHAVNEFVHSFIEALAIVLFVSYLHCRGAVRAARACRRVHCHERHGSRLAPDHARSADYRAWPPRRRRHHRRRDDGGKGRTGLRPHPRGIVCLGIHRLSDVDGDPGDGGRFSSHRLCQFLGG
jgi:multidrug efflux pump subunit AcrB